MEGGVKKHGGNAGLDSNSTRQYRTLIVDDVAGSTKILGILFRRLGQDRVELANSGQEAIDKARAFFPEIIILDLMLGDMTGLTVARNLRQIPEFRQTLIVALSGNSSPEARQETREAGFDLHLAKPIGVNDVREIIARRRARQTDDSTSGE